MASSLAAIRYPFELDFGEGVVLGQIKMLMAGQAYRPLGASPPYVINNYPPVFHLVTAVASHLTGNMLATGRGVSVTSTLLASMIVAVLVWCAAKTESARLPRALAAVFAGLSFLSISYTATWGSLMRVDMLAHFFSLAGLLVFATGAARGRRVYWCALPFLLAVYTKQTAIAAPVACILAALFMDVALSLKLAALLLGMGLVSFAGLTWLTSGQFYFHVVTANHNAYDWHRMVFFLGDLEQRYSIEMAIAAVAAASLLSGVRKANRSLSASATSWIRPVLGVYLVTAFLVSLTIGKVASEVNYLIEFMGVVCICVGIALAEGFAGGRLPAASHSLASSLSAVFLPCLLLIPMSGLLRRPAIEWVEIPSVQEQHETAQLLEIIRNADGPVLSQNLTLLFLAGKPVEFQPCDMAHVAYQGEWDQSGFVARIEGRQYQLVILHFDVARHPDWEGFTPSMVAAIRGHYVPAQSLAGYWIYKPQPLS
ncbi:MAG: ArnT family glycosyltransferase [Candidatus Binatia bacterium]